MTSSGEPAARRPAVLAEPVTVADPGHPVHALTTFELRYYRRDLEHAIMGISTDAPVQDELRRKLDEVLAEQEARVRIQHASRKGAPGL